MRLLALSLLIVALPLPAAAQQGGVHGRLDADLVLEASLGGGAAFDAESVLGAGLFELRARYLGMAGLFVGSELRDALGGASGRAFVGADIRPVFLARFLLGASLEDRYWDLFFDSIGLDLGVAITPLDEDVGAALMIGFGFDVPLVFFDDSANGLSLRFFGRHVASLLTDRAGPNGGVNDWLAGATLVLRGSVQTGLPGWEPRRYELP